MHIALLGASGATGHQILDQAKDLGIRVTAIVRDPACLDDLKHDNLEVKVADIFKEDSLCSAFEGCNAVVSCLGMRGAYQLLPWAHVTLYSQSATSIIAAMKKSHITRFVVVTSVCTKYKPEHPWMIEWFLKPVFLGRILADMTRMEDFLESDECQDVIYTVVKPKGLTNGPQTDRQALLVEEGSYVFGGISTLSRSDLARFMLECLNTDKWNRKHVALGHI